MPARRSGKKGARQRKLAGASKYQIFISHSSSNNWIARQIAKELEALGFKTWLDSKDLKGGDLWQAEIKKAITASQEGLVLISRDSVKSFWVAFEIGVLSGQDKTVTPLLNDVKPKEMASMQEVQAIDLNEFDKFLEQLKDRIRRRS
jgi:hypothetical protein